MKQLCSGKNWQNKSLDGQIFSGPDFYEANPCISSRAEKALNSLTVMTTLHDQQKPPAKICAWLYAPLLHQNHIYTVSLASSEQFLRDIGNVLSPRLQSLFCPNKLDLKLFYCVCIFFKTAKVKNEAWIFCYLDQNEKEPRKQRPQSVNVFQKQVKRFPQRGCD